MATIKSTFKRFNGTDFDIHLFETSADLISETTSFKVLSAEERSRIELFLLGHTPDTSEGAGPFDTNPKGENDPIFNAAGKLVQLDEDGLISESLIPGGLDYLTINNPTFTGTLTGNVIRSVRGHTSLTLARLGIEWVENPVDVGSTTVTAVAAATTGVITLSGLQTIDAVSVGAGGRILVKDQIVTGQNGIYTAQTGSWIRIAADSVDNTIVAVNSGGTANGGKRYIKTTENNTGGLVGLTNEGISFGAYTNSFSFTSVPDGANPNIGTININNNRLIGLVSPTAASHAATKAYVDAVAAEGVQPINPVKAATTANITLSGTQAVDGVELFVNDRVLVKNQSTSSQNGIYLVKSGA